MFVKKTKQIEVWENMKEDKTLETVDSLFAEDFYFFLRKNAYYFVTESGKLYSELPNAFKYRTELVAGCTCNGNDQIGLAPISIESDPTLRKGDIVAGAEGLMVTGRGADKRGAALNMSPASPAVRAKYERPAIEED